MKLGRHVDSGNSLMENNHWSQRLLRKLFNFIPQPYLRTGQSWQLLRFYPAVIPATRYFEQWNRSIRERDCPGYQAWIDTHSLVSLDAWQTLQQQACHWQSPPKISIVTPVYNAIAHGGLMNFWETSAMRKKRHEFFYENDIQKTGKYNSG